MLLRVFCLIFSFIISSSIGVRAEPFVPLQADIMPGFKPSKEFLEGGLWMVMDKVENDTKTSPKRIRDEAINRYLKDVTCKLAPDYCSNIRVYITRIPYFNAMMAPNGMMTVWSGLLLRVKNESQLAAILGHELGHYLRRHSLDQFNNAINKTSFGAFLSLGLAVVGAGIGGSIANLVLVASIYAHGRENEYEADKYGIQLMAGAGYDVHEAAKIWQYIIDESETSEDDKKNNTPFFATHPNPEDRLEKLTEFANSLVSQGMVNPEKQEDRYMDVVGPYWSSFLEDEIKLNQLDKTQFLVSSLEKTGQLSGTLHYFKGELLRRRKQGTDIEVAKLEYQNAINFKDAPAQAYRALGMLFLKEKNMNMAKSNLRKYLELVPNANDREMIEFYIAGE